MVPQRNGARPRAGKVSGEADNKCSVNDRNIQKDKGASLSFSLTHTQK